MARIDCNNIRRNENRRSSIHDIVPATYHFFEIGGEKYFQIDTYGKPTRDVPNVPSQKMQFNKKTAEMLVKLLNKEFGLIGG